MMNKLSEVTKLEKKFAFWYRISQDALMNTKFLNQSEYEDQVKKIAEFDSVIHYSYHYRSKIFGVFSSTYVNPTLANQGLSFN